MNSLMKEVSITWKSILFREFKIEYILGFNFEMDRSNYLLIMPGGLRRPIQNKDYLSLYSKRFVILSLIYPLTGDLKLIAGSINYILDPEGIKKVNIIGSSSGGIMVQAFSALYPNTVNKPIISNTGTRRDTYKFTKKMKRIYRIMKILLKFLVNSILKRNFHRLFDSLRKKGFEYHEIIDMMVVKKKLGKKEMICHFKSLIQFQTDPDFDKVNLREFQDKLLVITAENDKGTGETSINDLLNIYPNAKHYHFQEGGHFPMIGSPEEYEKVVANFLL